MSRKLNPNAQAQAKSLRALAAFVRTLPDETFGCNVGMFATEAEARQIMAASPGDWTKDRDGGSVRYTKSFSNTIQFCAWVTLPNCRRVQKGTKIEPATAAYEVPVYEWECDDNA